MLTLPHAFLNCVPPTYTDQLDSGAKNDTATKSVQTNNRVIINLFLYHALSLVKPRKSTPLLTAMSHLCAAYQFESLELRKSIGPSIKVNGVKHHAMCHEVEDFKRNGNINNSAEFSENALHVVKDSTSHTNWNPNTQALQLDAYMRGSALIQEDKHSLDVAGLRSTGEADTNIESSQAHVVKFSSETAVQRNSRKYPVKSFKPTNADTSAQVHKKLCLKIRYPNEQFDSENAATKKGYSVTFPSPDQFVSSKSILAYNIY